MDSNQTKGFNGLLEKSGIAIKSNKEKFYEWLLRVDNKFTGNTELMSKAYDRIIEY